MKNGKRETSFINMFFWILGAIYLGELLIQMMSRLGLEIPDLDYYLKLQLAVFLPFGILAYFATKAKFSTFISALVTIFSLYIINFTTLLTYSFDDPIAYITENQQETIRAFTGNTLLLLPILIGFVAMEILNLVLPKIMKSKSVKEVLSELQTKIADQRKSLASSSRKSTKNPAKSKTGNKRSTKKEPQKKTRKTSSKDGGKKRRGRSKKTK